MEGLTSSLIIGFLVAFSSCWLIAQINERVTEREKTLSNLLRKRAKKN